MIGIDLVDMRRIHLDPAFIKHVLTQEEQDQFDTFTHEHRKKEYLAGRFAAKEAIFKAAGIKEWISLSVLDDPSGKSYVLNHPEIEVSISHDGDYCTAIAISMKQSA